MLLGVITFWVVSSILIDDVDIILMKGINGWGWGMVLRMGPQNKFLCWGHNTSHASIDNNPKTYEGTA